MFQENVQTIVGFQEHTRISYCFNTRHISRSLNPSTPSTVTILAITPHHPPERLLLDCAESKSNSCRIAVKDCWDDVPAEKRTKEGCSEYYDTHTSKYRGESWAGRMCFFDPTVGRCEGALARPKEGNDLPFDPKTTTECSSGASSSSAKGTVFTYDSLATVLLSSITKCTPNNLPFPSTTQPTLSPGFRVMYC